LWLVVKCSFSAVHDISPRIHLRAEAGAATSAESSLEQEIGFLTPAWKACIMGDTGSDRVEPLQRVVQRSESLRDTMPSPFPGMDPYLEAPNVWLEFHNALATELWATINGLLDPRYRARLTSYVANEELPTRLNRVEIVTTGTEQLVTVIELLSPSNKRSGHPDRDAYLRKRQHILWSSAHLMEIDLLRRGMRPPLAEAPPDAPYYVVLSRVERRPKADVWPLPLAEPLLVVPVPLLKPDADIALDLGAVVAATYDRGRFEREIDYRGAVPAPPLSPEETAWVEALLRGEGFRAMGREA
jgi:hypothetical protein